MSNRTLLVEVNSRGELVARVSSTYLDNPENGTSEKAVIAVFTAGRLNDLARITARAYHESNHGTYWRKSANLFISVLEVDCGEVIRQSPKNISIEEMEFISENETFDTPVAAIRNAIMSKAEEIIPLLQKVVTPGLAVSS